MSLKGKIIKLSNQEDEWITHQFIDKVLFLVKSEVKKQRPKEVKGKLPDGYYSAYRDGRNEVLSEYNKVIDEIFNSQ